MEIFLGYAYWFKRYAPLMLKVINSFQSEQSFVKIKGRVKSKALDETNRLV